MSAQARRAYAAFAAVVDAELYQAPAMPAWEALPEPHRKGWLAAIDAGLAIAPKPETIVDKQVRLLHETSTAAVARALASLLPPGTGFMLMTFDFGPRGNCAYVSNGEREDVIRTMREWLQRQGAL